MTKKANTESTKNTSGKDTKETKKKIPLVEVKKFTPTVNMPRDFEDQVDLLHQEVPKGIEWSGLLVFKDNGKFDNPNDLVIDLVGIYPFDIGTAGYTEFKAGSPEYSKKVIKAVRQFDVVKNNCKFGLIHTHHNMGTTFSSVDMSELQDNAENFQYYLSLIVNYAGKPSAKVAFSLEEHEMTIQKGGMSFKIKSQSPQIIVVDCAIKKTASNDIPWLQEAIDKIKEEKEAARPKHYGNYGRQGQLGYGRHQDRYPWEMTEAEYAAAYGSSWKDTEGEDPVWLGLGGDDERAALQELMDDMISSAMTGEELTGVEKKDISMQEMRALWIYFLTGDDARQGTLAELTQIFQNTKKTIPLVRIIGNLENSIDDLATAYFYKWFDGACMMDKKDLNMLANYSIDMWESFFKSRCQNFKYMKKELIELCTQWAKVPKAFEQFQRDSQVGKHQL